MPDGGENLDDVRRRVRAAFDEYVEKYPDETILVAAHDAVNKAIICDLMGIGMEHFWQIKQDNTCINVLEGWALNPRAPRTMRGAFFACAGIYSANCHFSRASTAAKRLLGEFSL